MGIRKRTRAARDRSKGKPVEAFDRPKQGLFGHPNTSCDVARTWAILLVIVVVVLVGLGRFCKYARAWAFTFAAAISQQLEADLLTILFKQEAVGAGTRNPPTSNLPFRKAKS